MAKIKFNIKIQFFILFVKLIKTPKHGLEKLKKPAKVLITSDSKYVIDSVDKGWVFNWQKNNFKDKKNPDLWRRFLEVYSKHDVDFQWIKDIITTHKMKDVMY